jgi:hypothetical protein
MLALTAITGIVSLAVGWLVTVKLFALAKRTGAAPERLLATGFAGLFGVGYPLAAVSRAPGLSATYEGALIFTIAVIGMLVGLSALNRFPQTVFRPGRRWAVLLAHVATAAGVVAGLGSVVCVTSAKNQAEMIVAMQPWALGLIGSIGVSMLWNAVESTLYHRVMKKRLALGLADAPTTHRFLLWALAGWAACAQMAAVMAIRASGLPILAPLPMGLIAASSLVSSLCLWLAFFMPEAYRARLERAAERSR